MPNVSAMINVAAGNEAINVETSRAAAVLATIERLFCTLDALPDRWGLAGTHERASRNSEWPSSDADRERAMRDWQKA
jgi:hypothetical protein